MSGNTPNRLLVFLLFIASVTTITCSSVRKPLRVEPLPPEKTPFDTAEKISRSTQANLIPLNAYIRLQREEKARGARIPYFGWIAENRRTDDVKTINYRPVFDEYAKRFAEALFENVTLIEKRPRTVKSELYVEIKHAKTRYNPETKKLRQFLTFRVIGRDGIVVYQNVSVYEAIGDLDEDPELLERALRENFMRLFAKVISDSDKIEAEIEYGNKDLPILQDELMRWTYDHGSQKGQNSGENGKQYAVIIGISDYLRRGVDFELDLNSPSKDAQDLFHVLNSPSNTYNFESRNVVVLLDQQATLRRIRSSLSRWLMSRVEENDTVLIYFAGHGIYDDDLSSGQEKKEKYFLPSDFDPNDATFNSALPMDEMTEYFERLPARNIVMIFDACHAGAAGIKDRTDELRRFSRFGQAAQTKVIFAAAKATQLSFEKRSNGIFTYYLLEAFRGGADSDGDGTVSVEETSQFVTAKVTEETSQKYGVTQQPVLKTNSKARIVELRIAGF